MFSYVFFMVAFIIAVVLVQPIEGETNEELHMIQEPLCRFVRSAISQTQFEEEAEARLQQGERSEEHTSELQSLRHLVCRLLLEKKNNKKHTTANKCTHNYIGHTDKKSSQAH